MDKKITFALRALAFSACLFMVSCNEEAEKKTEEAPASTEAPAPTPEPAAAPTTTEANAAKPEEPMDTNSVGNTKPTETNVRK